MLPSPSTAIPCGEVNWPGARPACILPRRASTLPLDVWMLTRGPMLGQSRLISPDRPPFADIDERVAAGRHAHAVRPVQIVPLGLELAVTVEHLDPMVFPVGDIDPAIGVATDVVRDVELAGIGARLAPGRLELAVRRVFIDPRVAVAVGNVRVAAR